MSTTIQLGEVPRRPFISRHHLAARIWVTLALASALLPPRWRMGWWLPFHLFLLGGVSQMIVGAQLMFSATLAKAPDPPLAAVKGQLVLLNAGIAATAAGRVLPNEVLFGAGATSVAVALAWAGWVVHRSWNRTLDERFRETGTFYRLAFLAVLSGVTIGMALGLGWFDAESYAEHRIAHMMLNLLGWGALTLVGTAITLLPTTLRVRAARLPIRHAVPWILVVGLLGAVTAATLDSTLFMALGALVYLGGLVPVAMMMRTVLATKRRRRVPVSSLHLIGALGWLILSLVSLIVALLLDDPSAARVILLCGLAVGVLLQAVMGAWAFLLPMARMGSPEERRRELVAFEFGAKTQFVALNLGLMAQLAALLNFVPTAIGTAGLVAAWAALVLAMVKAWTFPAISKRPSMAGRSADWWVPLDDRGIR